ncbi:MAG: histidinol-phosphate aminotransferase family protein, partial [Candidatus Thorarchaeota archaeon]|nr:histidinol-phosphate aminotransferase family protein [Candidatus Thorarchaeota archaeon]
VIMNPTFSMYSVCTVRAGGVPIYVDLQPDFSLDLEGVLEACPDASLVFLCSPNNPTGNQFDTDDILRIVGETPGMVLLDEAYVEFADSSLVSLPLKYDNVVVLRTMSKAFGLASLRVGYCIASEDVAFQLRERLQLPYPVSSVAVATAQRMLKWRKVVLEACSRLSQTRARFLSLLAEVQGVSAFDSQANFVLMDCNTPSASVVSRMRERGYLLRDIGTACGYRNLVRVTVPPPESLDSVVAALREVVD